MAKPTGLSPLPSYKHPPVIEVSFGVMFKELEQMQARHLGQFWVEHRDEYPTSEDLNPLLDIAELGERLVLMQMPPLRRMMCYSQDKQYVAQVQNNRVYLNWRKIRAQDEYPRYDVVRGRFEHTWNEFKSFVKREKIGSFTMQRFELAYHNHVALGTDISASIEEHIKVLRFSPIKDSYLSTPDSVNAVWRFAMPQKRGTATASLSNATNSEGKNLLVLVLTCTGAPSERYSDTEWYESAHEWIVRSFTDLTTEKAHQKWEREK